jgi:hypothetical protein
MRIERWPQYLTLGGGAIFAGIETLHHLGLDQLKWAEQLLPHLTLIVGVVILGLLLEQQLETGRIRSALAEKESETFIALRAGFDRELDSLFGSEISRRIDDIVNGFRHSKFTVNTERDFRTYYKKALELHPRSRFYATSVASETYFWKPGTYESMFREFMRKGGSMERIFFVAKGPDQLSAEEERVIEAHADLGVKVYSIGWEDVPEPYREPFIVESKGRISWVSEIDVTGYLTRGVASSDRAENAKLVSAYGELRRLARPLSIEDARTTPQRIAAVR